MANASSLLGKRPPASTSQNIPQGRDGAVRSSLKGDEAEIRIDGVIGGDWYGNGITKEDFAAEMKKLKGAKRIDLRINSEGGSVFEADAIYALLRGHGAKIVVHIDSLAASAASFLALAGDEIEITEYAFVMIHNPYMMEIGDDEAMLKASDLLRKVKDQIASLYAKRTGAPLDQILGWMKSTTWFTGTEAVKNGFATKLIETEEKIAASIRYPDRIMTNLPTLLLPRRSAARAQLDALKRK